MITLSRLPTERAKWSLKREVELSTRGKNSHIVKCSEDQLKACQNHMWWHVIKRVGVDKKRKDFHKIITLQRVSCFDKKGHCWIRKLTVWKTSDKCVKNEMSAACDHLKKPRLIEWPEKPEKVGIPFFNDWSYQSVYRLSIYIRKDTVFSPARRRAAHLMMEYEWNSCAYKKAWKPNRPCQNSLIKCVGVKKRDFHIFTRQTRSPGDCPSRSATNANGGIQREKNPWTLARCGGAALLSVGAMISPHLLAKKPPFT